MADDAGSAEETKQTLNDNNSNTGTKPVVSDIEFQVSRVIERLEEAAVKASEGETDPTAGQTWRNSHGFLPLPEKSPEDILNSLQDLIIHEDTSSREESTDDEGIPIRNTATVAYIQPLDKISRLVVACHGIVAFSAGLERMHLQRVSSRIISDTTRWLSHLFRFYDCGVFFHDDMLEGAVRVTRMMLHYKYPRYLEDGFEALTAHLPVIYSSVASSLGVVHHICRQLGLPMACVKPVPCTTLFGSQKMDTAALERFMEEDKLVGRIPLIVLADAGMTVTGHIDNLPRLQELCRQYDVWLHLRGHAAAALTLESVPPVPVRIADSMTLPLGIWFGCPSLGTVTLFRSFDSTTPRRGRQISTVGVARESTLPLIANLTSDSMTRKLGSLPLWAFFQAMGREGIQSYFRSAFESCELVYNRLKKYSCLQLLGQQPGGESGLYTISEIIAKPVTNPFTLFEVIATSVVFQFIPKSEEPETRRVPPYFDKLNSWNAYRGFLFLPERRSNSTSALHILRPNLVLGQILQRDAPQVPIMVCELETNGIVLRYCPFEMGGDRHPTPPEIDIFISCLEQQLDILTATLQHKETFLSLVQASPRLRLVEMPEWAGLGGVRYVPEAWEQIMTDQAKEELNKLNSQLVEQLRDTDSAFSLGEGADNLVCVRFGMVTADTDLQELLGLVVEVGRELEESSRFLETMTEIVKKGIETAMQDLQKENEERIRQEGILRHVPVVGSFYNWWSPPNKEGGIKGRSLNLTAGVVESTENIYRYHMQLQQGIVTTPGTRSPPLPQVQTPVAPAGHSRSSSRSSQQSQPHSPVIEVNNLVNVTTSTTTPS